jgi:Tfp pilus assembly protein PilV
MKTVKTTTTRGFPPQRRARALVTDETPGDQCAQTPQSSPLGPRDGTAWANLRPSGSGPRHLASNAGFTLIEVAMAAFVMAFGIASSIVTMQAGFKQMDLARGMTIASQIIQSEMERLRMMSWTAVSALPATASFDGSTYLSSNPELAGKFTITRTVAANAANPAEIRDLIVAVSWQTIDGRPHTRSFTAIYAKNGLYDYYYSVAHP